jgi:hypothetical protein
MILLNVRQCRFCFLEWILVVLLMAVCSPIASAQSEIALESVGIAAHGAASHSGLVVVRCNVKNTTADSQEAYLVARVAGELTSEDRSLVRLSPQQMRTIDIPVRVPPSNTVTKVEVEVSIIAIRNGKEVLLSDGGQPAMRRVTVFRPPRKNIVTALAMGSEPVNGPEWRWEQNEVFSTMECALASRIDAELTNDCILLDSTPLPLSPADWQGIDTLIVSDPKYLREGAGLTAIRSYLTSGGRVWIMLDTIDCDLVTPLLSSNQALLQVDAIELEQCQVNVTNISLSEEDRTCLFDRPIPFKRVLQQGGAITHAIDQWPVGMVMPIGRGELVLTTLGSLGWIQKRRVQMASEPEYQSDYELRKWARSLVDIVHVQRTPPLLKLADLSYPLERIGNPVVPRSFVAWSLLLFCGALSAIGVWRWMGKEVSGMGFWIPGLAIAASLPIAIAGIMQRRDIPPSVALFQWAQYDSPVGGILRESAAVYTNEPTAMDLESHRNGFVVPDPSIRSGITTVVHEDVESWRLSNTAWPTGLWRYTTESTLPEKRMVARGEWTEKGLELRIPDGLPSALSDPILSYAAGMPVLGQESDNKTILFNGSYPAEGGRWTLQSLVDDEQRRQSTIYRKLLEGGDRLQVQTRTLFGWTELFSASPAWTAPLERRGAALVSLPISTPRPKIGTTVLVPYPFIEIRTSKSGDSTPIFMDSVGRWISQSSNPSSAQLEFHLPDEVTPLDIASIDVSWDIEAPRREARLWLVPPNTEPIELVTLDSPTLPWVRTIEEPDLLSGVGGGRIVLKIEVSDDREPGGTLPWRIKHLRLTVKGTVLPAHAFSKTPSEPK